MPSQRETARRGLRARNVRSALNAPMLPTPAPSAPRLIVDICTITSNQSTDQSVETRLYSANIMQELFSLLLFIHFTS